MDDDPDFHTVLDVRLRPYELAIDHAYHGIQGIAEIARRRPDLIVLDQSMPHGTGLCLLDVIRRNPATSHIPVIVATAMRDPNCRKALLQAGANVFLAKPVSIDELLHQISRFIDIREKARKQE